MGEGRRRGAGFHPELSKDVRNVVTGGLAANEEGGGNLGIGLTLDEQEQDFSFAARQREGHFIDQRFCPDRGWLRRDEAGCLSDDIV